MKTTNALAKILSASDRSGVYSVTGKINDFERTARAARLSVVKVDLKSAKGKLEFLASLAKTLKFPKHFGQNWDALHDLLTDLSWLKATGWVILLLNAKPFADRHTEDFETAVEVLNAATAHWRSQGKPFWVLVQGDKNWNAGLPLLPDSEP